MLNSVNKSEHVDPVSPRMKRAEVLSKLVCFCAGEARGTQGHSCGHGSSTPSSNVLDKNCQPTTVISMYWCVLYWCVLWLAQPFNVVRLKTNGTCRQINVSLTKNFVTPRMLPQVSKRVIAWNRPNIMLQSAHHKAPLARYRLDTHTEAWTLGSVDLDHW